MATTMSVVICAYDTGRWHDLRAAVDSVRTQATAAEEVIVVIDHNLALLVRARTELPDVDVVASCGPVGLSGARNTGTARAAGDVVAFLDDDATAERHWLGRLAAAYTDPHVLGAGGSAMPVRDTVAPPWWPAEFGWVLGCSYLGQPRSRTPVRNLMGCNMSFRRSVLTAVGGFDTQLGRTAENVAGGEETDLCIRAARHFSGGFLLYEPEAVVLHRVPASRTTWRYFRRRCFAEGVSKATITRDRGASSALASELAYTRRTLPAGIGRNIGAAVTGDPAGAARAAAIVAGLIITVVGYASARVGPGTPTWARPVPPVLPLIVDIDDPVRTVMPRTYNEYRHVQCLFTRSGTPVGRMRLGLSDAESLTPVQLAGVLVSDAFGRGAHADAPAASGTAGEATPADASAASGAAAAVPSIDASVVVATRNRPRRLTECLDSLLTAATVPKQIIVVDNAPSDERTAEYVTARSATEPRLVYVRENRAGLAHAHNAALPYTTGSIVAFTDDDVVVDERWLDRLARVFHDDERVACVTGLIAPRELDTLAQQWIEANGTFDKGLERKVFDADGYRGDDPLFPYAAGMFGSGANMAFRTGYLRGAGGFDAALGTGTPAMGGDDLAAFYDVIRSGHRIVYEPAAIVVHQHHRDYASLRRQTYGYGVGLGAHLTRCLARDPVAVWMLVRQGAAVRRRVTRLLAPPASEGLPSYPADLRRQQLRGIIAGPRRYVRSRRLLGAAQQPDSPVPSGELP